MLQVKVGAGVYAGPAIFIGGGVFTGAGITLSDFISSQILELPLGILSAFIGVIVGVPITIGVGVFCGGGILIGLNSDSFSGKRIL